MNFKNYKTKNLVIFVIVLSIGFSLLSEKIDKILPTDTTFKEIWKYIDLFSTLSLLFLTLWFIDEIGWKWKVFNWLVDIPNLNGRYVGTLESSFQTNGTDTIKDCVIEIRQSASILRIKSYYGDPGTNNQTSVGHSRSEIIEKDDNDHFLISHFFAGVPDPLQKELKKHDGASHMKYYPDKKTLDGEYFNDRPNKGNIKVSFKQRKLLGRLRENP